MLSTTSAVSLQAAEVGFGVVQDNKGLPVEVTSDSLVVDDGSGQAIFTGNVIIVQGEMRLSANEVLVLFGEESSDITKLEAEGDVVLISGEDAAESDRADYDVEGGVIVMTGNVLVAQGPTTISADRMTVQVDDGTAQMSGRVKTIFRSDDN